MISETEEIQLINRAMKGSQSAFHQLYDLHLDSLFRFLTQFTQDRDQVQEWTQRAFVKAFLKLTTFEFKSRFKTWLFTIGLNEMRTDMRSRFKFVELDEAPEQIEEESESEQWEMVKEAIKDLSPDKKIILLLHIAEGYSHKEIAEMLSIKEGTSRIILHRTKKELNKHMQHE
ncbi:MAG: RNA polymerase sigma factor [Balneolaceae bacterium]|nr:RNA polymerase sigma factor [Balneolaceae bacterium]MBO6547741.1 RNA polymerase sigma factor [Balneolaceae bacterium]MBO6648252.1 RNA polymerase sigma factor [Balneolaceae bacterium]